jgi:ankyrin repeat protein
MKRTIFAVVLALAAGMAIAKSPIEARKELNSIGLQYDNGIQFLNAVSKGDMIVVDLFLAGKGIGVNQAYTYNRANTEPLGVAIDANRQEAIDALLKAGATPTYRDLIRALVNKDMDLFKKLQSAPGFNIAAVDVRVIYAMAALNVDATLVDQTLTRLGPSARRIVNSAHPNAKPWTPHFALTAAARTHTDANRIIDVLVKHGADVNAIDPMIKDKKSGTRTFMHKHPETALFHAVYYVNPDAVNALLRLGADVNQVVVQENMGISFFNGQGAYIKRTGLDYSDYTTEHKNMSNGEQLIGQVKTMLRAAGGKTYDELQSAGVDGKTETSKAN